MNLYNGLKLKDIINNKLIMEITSKGYKIPLNHEQINKLKKDLFICPFVSEGNSKPYPIFRISTNYLYIPKYYGIKLFGIPDKVREQEGELDIIFNFNGKLRDYQNEIANNIYNHLIKFGSGLASLYTGWGKTCLALWLISKLQKKTLIIVHTENLLNQWIERIKEFLNEDVGVIQGTKVEIDKNICIGMIQSISLKDYENDTFKQFGFCIYDEVHHTPGRCFSKVFYKIGSKYNLGLSATLIRPDGLTKVIKYFLGETIVNLKLNIIIPKIIFIYSNEIEYGKEKTMINGKINIPGMINDLVENELRNFALIKIIKDKLKENRKILILSDRRGHCSELKRLLSNVTDDVGLYLGSMKNEELKKSNSKQIIIGTYQACSEGYDNPKLDTLIFATPKCNIEQAVGRILRQKNENEPEVIDYVDTFSIFNNFYFKRLKFYKTKKYIINPAQKNNSEQFVKLDKCEIIE